MPKRNIYIDFFYLFLLASSAGAVFTLGAIVAPIIFHSNEIIININLDHYNMGLIMATIFKKFSYWIYFLALYVALYEILEYKKGFLDKISLISAFFVFSTSMLFSGVYTPKILSMQALGKEATMSDSFSKLHLASEIDFKILLIALIVLFIRRLMLLRRA